MESKTSNLQGACWRQWALSQARVALALVLVKIKPSGVSARQYADALASKLRILDEGWKKEARDLQEQVLRLRQELLMSRVVPVVPVVPGGLAASSSEAAGCDRTVDPASQDLFGPECVVQTDSETPELPPSVPLQRPADTPRLQERPQEVFPHVEFLQSLCALQRVRGDDHGLEPLWFPPDADAGSLLADSVCQLLDSVVKACKDPPPFGPGDPVLQACRVVSQATDLFCSQRLPSVEFKRGVESSLEELTEMLLHRDWSSQLPAPENLSECLIVLGSNNVSKSFLIRHLLTRLSGVADQLWQVFQDAEGSAIHKFPLAQYHNSFHLFWIVKTLLQNSKVPYRAAAGSDATGFLAHLERRVFLLSEEFPLFSMYMWMIGGLLTSTGAGPAPAAAL